MEEKVEDKKKEEKWKPPEIERFLNLYEMYPCLWDYKVPEYKDRNAKEIAWEEIVKYMNKKELTVKKAKYKIRVLRNTYSNELMKIQKSKSSGKELDDVYTPTLRWFSTMDRIVGQVVQTRGSQSAGLPDEERPEKSNRESSPEIPTDQNLSQLTDEYGAEPLPRRKKRKHSSGSPLSSFISNAISRLEHVTTVQRQETEFDVWAKSVALQLNKMELSRALRLQLRLQSVLVEERIAYECGQ